jgi:glutamine synthetase
MIDKLAAFDGEAAAERLQTFVRDNPDIERIELLFPTINGIFRCKWLPPADIAKLAKGGLRLPISTYALDTWGWDVEATGLGAVSGDPDGIGIPVLDSLARIPWTKHPAAQILMTMVTMDGEPCRYDPRQILAGAVSRFKNIGLTPVVATELEFFFTKPLGAGSIAPEPPFETANGNLCNLDVLAAYDDVLHDIRKFCDAQGVAADVVLAEAGNGQFELNFKHVADAVVAADQAILFKRIVIGTAQKHGMDATFMAKPYGDDVGSGMHVHVSLIDENGDNVLSSSDGVGLKLQHAIGGVLATMRELQAIFAPNLNSYRRFQPNSFAPVSPVWGLDHRGVAVRVPESAGPGARLEHRICGADVNPHLAITAILGGMRIGLEKQIDPGPPIETGNGVADDRLHHDWTSTVDEFAQSAAVEDIFGDDFRRVYSALRHSEIEALSKMVSDVEYRTYLRSI